MIPVKVILLKLRVTRDVERMNVPNEESSESEETNLVTVLSSANGVMRVS